MMDPSMYHIEYVDLKNRKLVLAGDITVPITGMYDLDGDDTTDHDAVVTIAAGSGDLWFNVRVYNSKPATVH